MRFHPSLALLLAAAACSPAQPTDPRAGADAGNAATTAPSDAGAVQPGPTPAAAPSLVPIGASTPLDALKGELRCSFTTADGKTLLIAAADVDPKARPTAVVQTGASSTALTGTSAGGFDALRKGAEFSAEGLSVQVERGAAQPTGTEASRHTAVLTLDQAGATRRYDGSWGCGP